MRIAILGTGDVGQALGSAFIAEGHEVRMGSRSATNEKAVAWAGEAGDRASTGTFADAANWAEVVVIALLGVVTEDVLKAVGPDAFSGKLVIDTTNPLEFSGGFPPALSIGHTDSLGERVQRLLPDARVVKAFNTVGNALMYRPDLPGGPPTMLICGNDEAALDRTTAFLDDFGWETAALGGIEASRHLEPMCMVWVLYGARAGTWNHAFRILRG
jgi:predicted dinucleotide-binding enzyme